MVHRGHIRFRHVVNLLGPGPLAEPLMVVVIHTYTPNNTANDNNSLSHKDIRILPKNCLARGLLHHVSHLQHPGLMAFRGVGRLSTRRIATNS